MKRWKLGGLFLTGAMIAAASLVSAPQAAADDSFGVGAGACDHHDGPVGSIFFIDNGPGTPGNGESNDDYVEIWDTCDNHHGVKGWAWRNGKLLGAKYNGTGSQKRPVIWDPFGNLKDGDYVGIKVCEVDGSGDNSPGPCDNGSDYVHE
jgi:hypothetical protein